MARVSWKAKVAFFNATCLILSIILLIILWDEGPVWTSLCGFSIGIWAVYLRLELES